MVHVQDPILGHNDDFRRTWDKATYEKLAKERQKRETGGEGTGKIWQRSDLEAENETKAMGMRLGFGNETKGLD